MINLRNVEKIKSTNSHASSCNLWQVLIRQTINVGTATPQVRLNRIYQILPKSTRDLVDFIFPTFLILKITFLIAVFFPVNSFGFDFTDLMRNFEKDSARPNPLQMVERYKSVITLVSGMEVKNKINIRFQSRGSLRDDFFQDILNKAYRDLEKGIEGNEYLLKKLGLIKKEESFRDILYDGMFSNLSGLYIPKKKELLLIKGGSRRGMSYTMLHELVHAAQDSYVDLEKFHQDPDNLDLDLSHDSLTEGQAQAIQTLLSIKENQGDESTGDILKEVITRLEINMKDYDTGGPIQRLQAFPYTHGLLFVLKVIKKSGKNDFVKMFKRPPVSTEQVMHYQKFRKNEKPKKTGLGKKKDFFKSGPREIFSSTMGEFFISLIFDNTLGNKKRRSNKEAAKGWGGDRLAVYRGTDERLFLIWDSLWDSAKDSKEFFHQYKLFAQARFGVKKFSARQTFEIAFPPKAPYFLLKRKGKRVTVIEGEAPINMMKKIKVKMFPVL